MMGREAGVPHLIRRTGPFLYEVAEWCQERNLPSINALVVLDDEGVPANSYADAPGCSLVNWVDEAETVNQERCPPRTSERHSHGDYCVLDDAPTLVDGVPGANPNSTVRGWGRGENKTTHNAIPSSWILAWKSM
jgi:hypothetical protein